MFKALLYISSVVELFLKELQKRQDGTQLFSVYPVELFTLGKFMLYEIIGFTVLAGVLGFMGYVLYRHFTYKAPPIPAGTNISDVKIMVMQHQMKMFKTPDGVNVGVASSDPTQDELIDIDKKVKWGREKGFILPNEKFAIYLVDCNNTAQYGWQYVDVGAATGYAAGEYIQLLDGSCVIFVCRQILTNICHEICHNIIPNDPQHTDSRWKAWGVW